MPNRRRYKHRVPFNTSFEGDFLDEFKKECEAEDKDVNQVQQSLMEEYLKRKHTIREQQKLSIYGYRTDQQQQQQEEPKKKPIRPKIGEGLIDYLQSIRDLLEAGKIDYKYAASQIGSIQGDFASNIATCKIWIQELRRVSVRVRR